MRNSSLIGMSSALLYTHGGCSRCCFYRWETILACGDNTRGSDGEGWEVSNGRVWLDLVPCKFPFLSPPPVCLTHEIKGLNYLAFDIIGDLAFGSAFGMIDAGKDQAMAPVVTGEKGIQGALQGESEVCIHPCCVFGPQHAEVS